MAYGDNAARASGIGRRVTDYGYGFDDIQRAREATGRSSALNRFNVSKQFQDAARSLGGKFNQRGMVDSGLHARGRERLAGQAELARYGIAAQSEEAGRQLDRQRQQIEEQFYGGTMSDQIADALRRFGVVSTLGGIV
jgi:GAF domain-containing protein